MTAREVKARLLREGWSSRPGKGSHEIFQLPGRPILVLPNHRGDLAPGTLRSICKAAAWEWPPSVA
jgi:predicted RNA binding protein YcfA (HicA-like mRNA interferase family)